MGILFCGENPGFVLYQPEGPEIVTAVVSYWMSRDSVFGRGQALIVHSPQFQAVLSDNQTLSEGLNQRFTQHFPEFRSVGIPRRFLNASFNQTWFEDGFRIEVTAGKDLLDIRWYGILDRRAVVWADFPATGCDLSNVLLPCSGATLTINGHQILGSVRVDGLRSSAYIALSEVWSEREVHG